MSSLTKQQPISSFSVLQYMMAGGRAHRQSASASASSSPFSIFHFPNPSSYLLPTPQIPYSTLCLFPRLAPHFHASHAWIPSVRTPLLPRYDILQTHRFLASAIQSPGLLGDGVGWHPPRPSGALQRMPFRIPKYGTKGGWGCHDLGHMIGEQTKRKGIKQSR